MGGTKIKGPSHAGARSGYVLLGLLIAIWGLNWPIMKIGLEQIPPFWFAGLRLLFASAALFLLLAVLGRLRLPPRGDWPIVLSIGCGQLAIYVTVINVALLHVEASRSAILAYTTTVWVVPGAMLFLGERLTPLKAAGVVLGLGGVLVLFDPGRFDWSDGGQILGHGLLLFGALVWAANIVHARAHRWTATPLELAPWQTLIGAVPVLALAIIIDDPMPASYDLPLVLILVYNAFLASAFAFYAVVRISTQLPSITASLGFLGVPVTGVVAAILWLGEPATTGKLAGLVLIVAGVGLVSLAGARDTAGKPAA